MPLNPPEEDEVRRRVIEMFGTECVRQMDFFYMELNDIRIGSKDSYEFLEKVKVKYAAEHPELILAAVLYGMYQGEIGYIYHLKKQKLNEASIPGYH